jgi:hypothetical protein
MLLSVALRDFFEDAVPGIPGSMGSLPDNAPHRAFAVQAPTGGLGLELENDALDKPSFTLLIRGVNGADAEEWGYALDNAWLDAPATFDLGGYLVLGKGRFGNSPPAEVGVDDFRRVIRAATYWCRIER